MSMMASAAMAEWYTHPVYAFHWGMNINLDCRYPQTLESPVPGSGEECAALWSLKSEELSHGIALFQWGNIYESRLQSAHSEKHDAIAQAMTRGNTRNGNAAAAANHAIYTYIYIF